MISYFAFESSRKAKEQDAEKSESSGPETIAKENTYALVEMERAGEVAVLGENNTEDEDRTTCFWCVPVLVVYVIFL